MGLGTLTLLGLLGAPGQIPADVTVSAQPSVILPIDYTQERRNTIKELILYASTDFGANWSQYEVGKPEDINFKFAPAADGLYWLTLVVVDKSNNRIPADPRTAKPHLKMLFDRKKPEIQIRSAERFGDTVTVNWAIDEANPVWETFSLESTADGRTWVPQKTRPELKGSASFKAPGAIGVRVRLTDVAKNTGEATGPVTAAGTPVSGVAGVRPPAGPVTPAAGTGDGMEQPGPALVGMAGDRGRGAGVGTPTEPPPASQPSSSGYPAALPPPPAPGSGMSPTMETVPAATRPAEMGVGAPVPSGALPPEQVINVTSFRLAYEVEERGTSGVRRADIYVTKDDGKTWGEPWQSIDNPESPLTVNLARDKKGLEVPANQIEGQYGIKVVLHSGAGLTRGGPRPGDAPDMRVVVDLTAPTVTFFYPKPDPVAKDTLTLKWVATDKNLAENPITLEWSESPHGPWLPVAADARGGPKRLANTGSFAWKVPTDFPAHQVHIKIAARDTAGNVAEFVSKELITVDMSKPTAVRLTISGAAPAPR